MTYDDVPTNETDDNSDTEQSDSSEDVDHFTAKTVDTPFDDLMDVHGTKREKEIVNQPMEIKAYSLYTWCPNNK